MRQAGVIVFSAILVSGCGPLPPPASGQRSCATLLAADTFRAISATTVPRGLEHTEDAELDLVRAAALN